MLKIFKGWLQKPLPSKPDDVVDGLRKACAFTARYWADVLREQNIDKEVQLVTLALGQRLPVLDSDLIDVFQSTLEALVFQEISQVE